ncbi:hypothetical protein LINPERHAP1_LOCUS30858 [Linum perenne]
MKSLAWRIARGVVPTRMVLSERGLSVEMFCGVCGSEPETPWHLIIDCGVARDCWQAAGLQLAVDQATEEAEGLADWLWTLIRREPGEIVARICAIVWGIWRETNARVWRQESRSAEIVTR